MIADFQKFNFGIDRGRITEQRQLKSTIIRNA